MNIIFTSKLEKRYSEELEKLLFFNPRQKDYIAHITNSINLFGLPEIEFANDNIKITIDGLPDAQTLYALDTENLSLIGIMIFSRIDDENLILLHIGVIEDYSSVGIYSDELLVPMFIHKLRKIAKMIKGVKMITLMYGHSKLTQIRV